jgi:opacity protein-like surface antigen
MKFAFKNILFFIVILFFTGNLFAENAGSRGAFTRGGWAGARYVAAGMTGEVLANDVFAIYWNPAGLSELKAETRLTESEVSEKARTGQIDEITEEDLLSFSETGYEKMFVHTGASYSGLDFERDAMFAGIALSCFSGVAGAGFYSIASTDIETRDETGAKTGTTGYSGSVAYLSYAYSANVASIGVSLKGIHEKIDDAQYGGAGADIGVQVFLLPFIKLGIMARDLGSFLKPYDSPEIEDRYDFFYPEFKIGLLFTSDSGFRIAFNGTKRLEQTGFMYGGGLEYDLTGNVTVMCGLSDDYFSTGASISIVGVEAAYSFSFDRIDTGYNNTVSLSILF